MDILIVYQFCSFGGVERALLNRAVAFQKHGIDVVMSIGYLEDYGALASFKEYIRANSLENKIIPFLLPNDYDFSRGNFNLIFVIDTPVILEKTAALPNVIVECHTPYIANRQYLNNLPDNIKDVIVPSQSFGDLIKSEFPNLPNVFVVTHSVPDIFFEINDSEPKFFSRRPITYLARLDPLKNFDEALLLFTAVKERDDIFQLVVGRGWKTSERIARLENEHLLETTFFRDQIKFDNVPRLVNLVRNHRGVFISPSKGESFGLSASEFICGGVPVLLSDIPEHKELVNHDESFLYPLGDIKTGRKKLIRLLQDWDAFGATIKTYGGKFRSASFIDNWNQFLKRYGYNA